MGQQFEPRPETEASEPVPEAQIDKAQEGTEEAQAAPDLSRRLAECEAKVKEHWDQVLRARADLENERRRFSRDLESTHKFAVEKLVLELLPVKDSLEMGLAAAAESADAAKLREGMELTLKMLQSALEKFGVSEVNPLGQRFNPQLHESMSAQETAAVEPNTVVNVFQKGYLLKDRLLRPALVVISRPAATTSIDERA
jgi:molecular chaperone GrpE